MTTPLVSLQDLSVQFCGNRKASALNEVNIELAAGEVLGLLGESGSGKSVTLRTLLRLHPERTTKIRGRMLVDGQDVLALKGRALELYRGGTVSMVFQEPGLAFDPVYTVGQQITEAIRAHESVTEQAARARALLMLERVQIPQAKRRFDAYPHELSGGMRQRAMIALALACQPKLLLADEPTTALDATVQIQILLLLRELQRETGMSVIFVTHDIGAAVEVADRIAVMYAGRIVEQGPVGQLVRAPRHPYTAGLLAATVGTENRGQPLMAVPGSPPDLAALPPGCSFAPRCKHADEACRSRVPPLLSSAGQAVACWHPLMPLAEAA
ncbi:peptide/nickel transport system ATP-binding protein [Azonexus fungiphilus]|jgi:peptide/nickel transport system ATP-binding protein|uniref:Peptide/nickel transport system ATP-binding protein n=1 Tax=Azonexus fungiphilus TaxID=146940 RepID=A0A495WFN3_9RHOO|nr:ABC transporter ATP-binding protein [Azonexus fungiphilus]RKT58608.1 peptide/nickel transport system ATP-binding protein [Azonexus fungiphilus]